MASKSVGRIVFQIVAWLAVIGAITGTAIYYYTRVPPIPVTVAKVVKGKVEETVPALASGTILAPKTARVASAGLGTIGKVHVEDGQQVKEGDLLVELDHVELDAQVTLAEANLKVGESRLQQARIAAAIGSDVADTRMKQAAAQLESVKVDHGRVKKLAEQKAVSQSDMDKISLALRVAQETFNAAEASQRETLVRKEDIHAAEAAIEQLRAAIEAAKAMREKTLVRAPFDGIITRVLLKRGEAVAMGLPLLEIVSPANNYIEAPFDEVNAAKIKVGQRARITLDAYPGKEFDGEVSFVSPVVNLSLERSRTLTAKIRATNQPEIFLPGMSAEVTILVQTKDDVLYIPTESVIRDEYVYVLAGGKAVRRTVKLGIGNWERHEVLSGIGAGDTLITSVAIKGIADGVAVRAVDSLE